VNNLAYKAQVVRLPDNADAQVAETIALMCRYVCADCQAQPVIEDARQALALSPAYPLSAVHSFVRSRMRFKRDEDTMADKGQLLPNDGKDNYFVECLKRPVDVSFEFAGTGERVEGDCDDFSMYTAALLKALGIECCFATVGANDANPDVYSHVYVVAYFAGQRVPMDCSHGAQAGWEAPNQFGKFREWAIYDRDSLGAVGIVIAALGFTAWKFRKQIRGFFA